MIHDRSLIEHYMAERRRLGIDRRDEVRDGELVLTPPPTHEPGEAVFGPIERAVVVIDRDTKRAEVFRLEGDARVAAVAPAADGALHVEPLGIVLRPLAGARLEAFLADDPARRAEI